MFAKSAVAVALLAAFAAAQANNANSTIDAGTIPPTLRSQWCNAQQNTCPKLCGSAKTNDCDVTNLTFNCTCSNGTAPGLVYYQQTMPTFICEKIYDNCIITGANNAQAQRLCDEAKKANCGTLDPSKFTAPAPSSATPSATPASESAASATVASTSSSKAAAATMAVVAQYGSGVIVAGAAAAFGLLL